MIDKKLVWRAASKLGDEFSINDLIDEISKEATYLGGIAGKRRFFKLDDIMNSVIINNNAKRSDIMSRKRDMDIKNARHIGMYLAYKYTEFGLHKIGDYFERDHSTVVHARRRIKDAKKGFDPELLKLLKVTEKTLLSNKISYTRDINKCNYDGCNNVIRAKGLCYKHLYFENELQES